jgi:hypothetical protein
MSSLWTPGLAERARRRLERRPVTGLIAAAVRQEFADADLVDPVFVAEMIWDGYLAALRRATLGGLTPPAVKARIDAVARTILAGAQPG